MPRAPKLPPLSAAARDAQWDSTLALAVIKLRASAAWTSDEQAEALCETSRHSAATRRSRGGVTAERSFIKFQQCLRFRPTARGARERNRRARGACSSPRAEAHGGRPAHAARHLRGRRLERRTERRRSRRAHRRAYAIYRFNSAPTGVRTMTLATGRASGLPRTSLGACKPSRAGRAAAAMCRRWRRSIALIRG